MQIVNIQKEFIEPLNILEDGTMDPTKSTWRFGGVQYHVEYTNEHTPETVHIMTLQNEKGLWYEPCYNYSSSEIMEVIQLVEAADRDMFYAYKQQEELTDDLCE